MGALTDDEVTRATSPTKTQRKAVFRAMVCGSSLSIFADPRGTGTETCAEDDFDGEETQISSHRSIEISGE